MLRRQTIQIDVHELQQKSLHQFLSECLRFRERGRFIQVETAEKSAAGHHDATDFGTPRVKISLTNIWDIRSRVGMVFQNPDNQLIATTVEDDVAFGCENLGIQSSDIRVRVDDALSMVGMAGFGKKEPHYLSGGQKQRVAIAGVIAMRPKYLVLDEPTAMLDPRGRQEVMETIHKLNKDEGLTIVHITHYMEEATKADRVVVMEDGKIVTQGCPREIFSQVDLLKSLRMDVPPMTELASRLSEAGLDVDKSLLTVEEMVDALC